MNTPKLKKIKSEKKYHNITLKDDYSWVDQPDILDVLKDPKKLLPEVKKYIEDNNAFTDYYFKDIKDLQKKLFHEINYIKIVISASLSLLFYSTSFVKK